MFGVRNHDEYYAKTCIMIVSTIDIAINFTRARWIFPRPLILHLWIPYPSCVRAFINDLRILPTRRRNRLLQCRFEPTAKAANLPEISLVENLAETCDYNFLRKNAPLGTRDNHRFAGHICMKFAREIFANQSVYNDITWILEWINR